MYHLLAIDDDEQFLQSLVGLLQYKHYHIETLSNPTVAIQRIREKNYDCILLDVKMPGIDGIRLLEQIIKEFPQIPIIMISGQSTLSIAVDAIKKGAYDFMEKGGDSDRLLISVQNAIEKRQWLKERSVLINEIYAQFRMVGKSRALQDIFEQIKIVAPTDAKVLIYGETGTGKELVARAIKLHSKRAAQPFISVNCAAIPETLIESTFFGHLKGSFSGAISDQPGKFELAHGGTIFLDEIGELNLQAQSKLLRVLEDGEIEKIGAKQQIKVDVRIIAATNKDLQLLIKQGKFREDLYHRLKIIEINIPPLKERKEDIPLLARHFLQKYSEKYNKSLTDFSPEAINILLKPDWPGNVRMLKNVIEKTVVFAREPLIRAEHISLAIKTNSEIETDLEQDLSLQEFLELKEKEYIERALILSGGRKQAVAEKMGVDRATLWRKMRKYHLDNDVSANTFNSSE